MTRRLGARGSAQRSIGPEVIARLKEAIVWAGVKCSRQGDHGSGSNDRRRTVRRRLVRSRRNLPQSWRPSGDAEALETRTNTAGRTRPRAAGPRSRAIGLTFRSATSFEQQQSCRGGWHAADTIFMFRKSG